MRHTLPVAPQFYVTAPQPCPYLEGRMERKLFTALQGDQAERLNDALSNRGSAGRRTCSTARPARNARPACRRGSGWRISGPAAARNARSARNAYLQRRATSPWATEEQYALFRRYLDSRHADGGMADMDLFEFAAMIEETPIRSRLIEYADPDRLDDDRGGLTAVCLTDILEDGLSMVYSFFDPGKVNDSLGTYVILDHVRIARDLGLPYVYLGYWVPGSPKMGYKASFSALEVYRGGSWQPLGDPADYSAEIHPLSVDPIAEQVARITLPDRRPVQGTMQGSLQASMKGAIRDSERSG
jgi:leucyl-tRNA---protein transferase